MNIPQQINTTNKRYDSAQDVLDEHWRGEIPVNVRSIANSMGVLVEQLMPHDFELSGKFEFVNDYPVCYYNPTEAPVRQKFTMAHELGHYALGHGRSFRDPAYNFGSNVNDYNEYHANNFAAQLLMPKQKIFSAVRVQGHTDIGTLSRIFEVSEAAMMFRLKNLGLIS